MLAFVFCELIYLHAKINKSVFQGTTVHHNRSKSVQDSHPNWTSLDLEMDLKASETKLSHLQDELSRLRELKKKMELAKSSG